MEALITPNSSYVWRSIVVSRHVINKGHRWQVGNGQRIRLWKDNWILRDFFFFRILTPSLRNCDKKATVVELIWSVPQQWNIPLLNALFSPKEVKLI